MNNIATIIINQYPDKVLVANARRPKYYLSGSKIPKSFLNEEKFSFDSKGRLINLTTGLPQLANPKLAGTARYWVVNFQDIWNGNIGKQARANYINKLKDVLRPHIVEVGPIEEFPIEISILMYDTNCPVDVSNRGAVYTKVIEDLLVKEGIIPDDSYEYVNCSGRIKFIQIEDVDEKRMEIRINKSDNTPF